MNKKKKPIEHPEVQDLKNICDVSPHTTNTQDVCDKIKSDAENKESNTEDEELDETLEETFPASDAIAKY